MKLYGMNQAVKSHTNALNSKPNDTLLNQQLRLRKHGLSRVGQMKHYQ